MNKKEDKLYGSKYVHTRCKQTILVRSDIAKKLLENPKYTQGTCTFCGNSFPLSEFEWVEPSVENR